MKTLPLLVLSASVSVVTALVATSLLVPQPPASAAGDAAGNAAAHLQSTLTSVQQEQRALRDSLENLALRLNASNSARNSQPLEELDAVVARALDERLEQLGALQAGAPSSADAAAEAGEELDVADSVAALLDPELGERERQELWEALREAGLLDEVVAVFEARVKANPNDPALHVDLAKAYLQKIFEVGSGPLAGVWADKADAAFDAALALDSHQWDARFNKAVSLSFWPPIFGKQAEAISQFETLVAQQQSQPPKPHFAQTYLWLGNLYQQQGKSEQAAAAWKQGLALFPNDADLQGKLAGS